MTRRTETRLSLAGCALGLGLGLAGLAIDVLAWSRGPVTASIQADVALAPALLLVTLLGALIATRRPGNRVGRLFCVIALLAGVIVFCDAYASYGIVTDSGSLPAAPTLAWLATWISMPVVLSVLVLLPLIFPTGRPLTPRWRAALWLVALQMTLIAIGQAFSPGSLEDFPVDNPLAIGGLFYAIQNAGWILMAPCLALAATSIVLRFRRAHGLERQQVKWLALGACVAIVAFPVSIVVDVVTGVDPWNVTTPIVLSCVIFPAGLAVLRYRLYEIDRVISRTAVYGLSSALLAGLYFGLVLALQQVFSSFAGGSDLAIAGSTLVVAALFRPARRRIQAIADRRFYRRRYDAQRTLEAFGRRLREEVDLASLAAELRSVVQQAMQPSHVSLWIRPTNAVTISKRSLGRSEVT